MIKIIVDKPAVNSDRHLCDDCENGHKMERENSGLVYFCGATCGDVPPLRITERITQCNKYSSIYMRSAYGSPDKIKQEALVMVYDHEGKKYDWIPYMEARMNHLV